MAVLLVGAIVFGPGAWEQARLLWKQHTMDQQLTHMRGLSEQYTKEQQRLTSDPVYVEGLIRTTFKVANPDEMVVSIEEVAQRRSTWSLFKR